MEFKITSKQDLNARKMEIWNAICEMAECGGTIEIKKAKKQRTITQNKALHKYLELLADALNDAGYDMKRTLKQEVDIPWNMESAKEYLWRPVQKVLIDQESTTDATTDEYNKIYLVLSKHISEKFGVYVPWPSNRG
jgi:hypothetical protein